MRRHKRKLIHLLFGISFLMGLGYLIYSYPPTFNLQLSMFALPILPIFFLFLSLSVFFIFSFIFNHSRRGLFASLIVLIYFLLRLLHLTQPFFAILLIVFFGILELSFSKRV